MMELVKEVAAVEAEVVHLDVGQEGSEAVAAGVHLAPL
jgi:hypothetical protein